MDCGIAKVDYSGKAEIKKENKSKAIKEAKEQAYNMLAAIGQQPGKPFEVSEFSKETNDGFDISPHGQGINEIGFKKIKYTSTVTVKFEIK